MTNFDEKLKNAIAKEDIAFLEVNKNKYSINHRFQDENNDTLLLYALSDSGSNTYEYFLKNNADITLVNDEGENIIHSIIYSGQKTRLVQMLNQYHSDINIRTKDGTTPLLLSVLLEKYEIFNCLLKNGADVNISDNEGNTPLHPACFHGNKLMVFDLVENGANLFAKTLKGNLPLALAVNGGHEEIIKYLFNKIYK
jgi:ankyrin repeat protein